MGDKEYLDMPIITPVHKTKYWHISFKTMFRFCDFHTLLEGGEKEKININIGLLTFTHFLRAPLTKSLYPSQ